MSGADLRSEPHTNTAPVIDYFRLICAALVVAIHCSPLLSANETADFIFTRVIARIAVPYFFMISGYYIVGAGRRPAIRSFVVKTLRLYGLSILLFLPLNIYGGHFDGMSLGGFFRDLLFNGTVYHLWFLPASVAGALIVSFLRKKLGLNAACVISLLLYIVGLCGDSYYGLASQLPAAKTVLDALFILFDYTRNGLFFAPVFFALGLLLSERKARPGQPALIAGLCISAACLLAEALILRRLGSIRHDSMYVFLLPLLYFLFHLLLRRNSGRSKYSSRIALLVYILHPWAIVFVRGAAKLFRLEWLLIENSPVHYLCVLLLSFAAACLIERIRVWVTREKTAPSASGRAWLEINIPALRHNAETLQLLMPSGRLMPVLKANAYGHGDVACARALIKSGCTSFAVATVSEGVRLREAGIGGEILILGYTHPDDFGGLADNSLSQTILDYGYAEKLSSFGKAVAVHVKLDTGMHRLGIPADDPEAVINAFRLPHLQINGTFTHLSDADRLDETCTNFTRRQIALFSSAVEAIRAAGYNPGNIHIQGSYGLLNYPELKCDLARCGIALYGVHSRLGDATVSKAAIQPVLALKARIASVRHVARGEQVGYNRQYTSRTDITAAVLSIGYADGLPRNLREGRVIIHGQYAYIIGRLCMDQIIVDVSDIDNVRPGDIATLIGHDGDLRISAEEVAEKSGSITNELLSRLGPRLQRIYIE